MLFSTSQGPLSGSHGPLLAPRRIQLCVLQELLGRCVLCGGAEQCLLWAVLWAVLCPNLCQVQYQNHGGKWAVSFSSYPCLFPSQSLPLPKTVGVPIGSQEVDLMEREQLYFYPGRELVCSPWTREQINLKSWSERWLHAWATQLEVAADLPQSELSLHSLTSPCTCMLPWPSMPVW